MESRRLRLEQMKNHIDSFDVQEHKQLYDIILKYTDKISKTSNGVFISSEHLSEECLQEIEKHIQFCLDQHQRFIDDQKERKVYEKLTS